MTEHADLVIVDSPPVLAVADPLVVASVADGVIVVASTTDRRKITRAIGQLQQIEAPVLGTVLNGFEFTDDVYTASYGYAPPPADAETRWPGSFRHRHGECVMAALPGVLAEVEVADFETELVVLVPSRRLAHHLEPVWALVFDSCRAG